MSTQTLIHDGQNVSPAVAAVRAKLLDGLATVEVFAEASDKTPRTVFGWNSARASSCLYRPHAVRADRGGAGLASVAPSTNNGAAAPRPSKEGRVEPKKRKPGVAGNHTGRVVSEIAAALIVFSRNCLALQAPRVQPRTQRMSNPSDPELERDQLLKLLCGRDHPW